MNQYQLIDFGNGRKLEQFGPLVVDRPSPGATKPLLGSPLWGNADLSYDADSQKWDYRNSCKGMLDGWSCEIDGIQLRLKPTAAGQVGAFPEHWEHWEWMRSMLLHPLHHDNAPSLKVLSLFAYTGATSLWLAGKLGCEVTHVDASRPTVQWARENASLSGLADAPIRWVVEDAFRFVEREVRRGRQYDAVLLDPPTFGHGTKKERWEIGRDLLPLVEGCWQLLSKHRCFVLLTGHSAGIDLRALTQSIREKFGGVSVGKNTLLQGGLRDGSGRLLDCGYVSRFEFHSPRQEPA